MKPNILIIDDEENIRFTLAHFLSAEGYGVTTAEDYDAALKALDEIAFDLIFADIVLRNRSGVDILKEVNSRRGNCPVVMITGVPTVETASAALRLGAFDYLPKPVLQEDCLRAARAALRHKRLLDDKARYRANLEAIFAGVKDAIISVDAGLTVTELNTAAGKICGLERSQALGQPLKELKFHCGRECLEILKSAMDRNRTVEHSQMTCQWAGGPEQVVSLTATPLRTPDGSVSGCILVVRDLTRLVTLERSLKMRHQFHNLVGKSEDMQAIYSRIEDLADVSTTVLISGESGTGKELVADALHYQGADPDKPMVKVNCAALAENLLESELFGHVKGAFSGAHKDRAGRFQRAHGGTIFLDEVGLMSPAMQGRLLRVLQEKEFERVGDATPIKVDVRVIAATNLDLKGELAAGRFRQDLFFRLKVIELRLPPLRKRREDIPLLVDHFMARFRDEFAKPLTGITPAAKQLLLQYPWPGNVRELRHAVEHAFILCRRQMIGPEHLPPEISAHPGASAADGEREHLLKTLEQAHWNKTRAARMLGMSRQHLYRKMKQNQIAG